MKDAYWFKHDSNAKDDPKCVLLIEQLGLEGYGIYWVLVETLRDQPEYKYPLSLIPALARRYNTSSQKVEAVIRGYQLFDVDEEKFFFSPSLLLRMEQYDDKREQARLAAKTRWKKEKTTPKLCERNADALPTQSDRNAIREEKRREEKNISKQKHGEFQNVLLTEDELQKLKSKFPDYQSKIEKLSEYVASKGVKYKSHYATILSWSRKEEPVKKSEEVVKPEIPEPQFESEEQRQAQIDFVAELLRGQKPAVDLERMLE